MVSDDCKIWPPAVSSQVHQQNSKLRSVAAANAKLLAAG